MGMEHLKGKILLYLFVIGVIRESDSFPDNVGAGNNDGTIASHLGPMMKLLLQFLPPELHNNAAIVSAVVLNNRIQPSRMQIPTTIEVGESSKAPFETMREYEEHVRALHPRNKIFHCADPACGSSFRTRLDFYRHRRERHGLRRRTKVDSEELICRKCGESSENLRNLVQHFNAVHPEDAKPFQCGSCNHSSFTKYAKMKHEKRVHGLKYENMYEKHWDWKYECERCGKEFSQNDYSKYSNHKRNHRRYTPCPICGQGFRSNDEEGRNRLIAHVNQRHPEHSQRVDYEEVFRNRGKIPLYSAEGR